jgi:hypothetical protein
VANVFQVTSFNLSLTGVEGWRLLLLKKGKAVSKAAGGAKQRVEDRFHLADYNVGVQYEWVRSSKCSS